jgi:hypothetical protein
LQRNRRRAPSGLPWSDAKRKMATT